MQRVWKEHRSWVTNVHLQRGGQRELVSACRNGEVKLWDLRWDKSIRTIRATRDTLRTLSVHEHAPVFAVGTDRHCVRVFSMMDMENSNLTATSIGTLATPVPSPAIVTAPPTTTITNSAVASGAVNITVPNMSIGSLSGGARLLSSFEPYSSFLHQSRGSPIAATAFHPHRMMIAGAALGDTHVNIFACRKSGDVD
jgi:regulator-associated protein of mTOR